MTTVVATGQDSVSARTGRDRPGWLGLAASPTLALMAWIAASEAPGITLCSAMPGRLPIDGMAWMYLLMSFFHLSPWLTIASARQPRRGYPLTLIEGD